MPDQTMTPTTLNDLETARNALGAVDGLTGPHHRIRTVDEVASGRVALAQIRRLIDAAEPVLVSAAEGATGFDSVAAVPGAMDSLAAALVPFTARTDLGGWVDLGRTESCPFCGGTGDFARDPSRTCNTCTGRGTVTPAELEDIIAVLPAGFTFPADLRETCLPCSGTGCDQCGNLGWVIVEDDTDDDGATHDFSAGHLLGEFCGYPIHPRTGCNCDI